MKQALRLLVRFLAVAAVAVVVLVAWGIFENWRTVHHVRTVFGLVHSGFDPAEIQAFLKAKFPAGTPRSDIEDFLRHHFGNEGFGGVDRSRGDHLYYMLDCGSQFPAHNFIYLTFTFTPDERMNGISAEDRSKTM